MLHVISGHLEPLVLITPQNRIKQQARQHEGFRQFAIRRAQALHRWDMRLRLGLLQDTATIDRQIAREAQEALNRKKAAEIPTVKTEAETKAAEHASETAKEKAAEAVKSKAPKIRPLSETKAIDMGANFVSESFIFAVGIAVLVWAEWLSRRSAAKKRSGLEDRIQELESSEKAALGGLLELEKEILRLRAKDGKTIDKKHILPPEIWQAANAEEGPEELTRMQKLGEWVRRLRPFGVAKSEEEKEGVEKIEKVKEGGEEGRKSPNSTQPIKEASSQPVMQS